MLLEDVIEEYFYSCMAKGFTKKTMINKRKELKQLKKFLEVKRGIYKLESITVHDLKVYMRMKQKSGLQPQSIVSMGKQMAAFFNWCAIEETYVNTGVKFPKNAGIKILTFPILLPEELGRSQLFSSPPCDMNRL